MQHDKKQQEIALKIPLVWKFSKVLIKAKQTFGVTYFSSNFTLD